MTDSDPGIQPLHHAPPLRQLVHGRLEALIIDGSLAAGAKLGEAELAVTLGVSRGPIREAFQSLAQEGYVDLRPRQGAYVHEPSQHEVEDLFDVRVVLEAQSARLAAARATKADHDALRKIIDSARSSMGTGDARVDRTIWQPVHEAIARIADNALLNSMLGTLEKRFRWYLSPFAPSQTSDTLHQHEAIVDAIIAGDEDLAEQRMAAHIQHSKTSFFQRSAGIIH